MTPAAPLSLTDRLTKIIWFVCQGIDRRARPHSILGPALPVPLLLLIGTRLMNLRRRFTALVLRMQAGPLPKLPEPGTARKRKATERKPRPNLVRDYGVRERWGWATHIACTGTLDDMQRLLDDPEMHALIAAEPRRMGRILRPLCRMLGVQEIPDLLRLASQSDIVTIDWAAHARLVEAEKAAQAAGLPLPVWPEPKKARKAPFRFYLTPYGQPLLE
jgi:hypothetical protein